MSKHESALQLKPRVSSSVGVSITLLSAFYKDISCGIALFLVQHLRTSLHFIIIVIATKPYNLVRLNVSKSSIDIQKMIGPSGFVVVFEN